MKLRVEAGHLDLHGRSSPLPPPPAGTALFGDALRIAALNSRFVRPSPGRDWSISPIIASERQIYRAGLSDDTDHFTLLHADAITARTARFHRRNAPMVIYIPANAISNLLLLPVWDRARHAPDRHQPRLNTQHRQQDRHAGRLPTGRCCAANCNTSREAYGAPTPASAAARMPNPSAAMCENGVGKSPTTAWAISSARTG